MLGSFLRTRACTLPVGRPRAPTSSSSHVRLPAWGQDAALGAGDHRAYSPLGLGAGPCHHPPNTAGDPIAASQSDTQTRSLCGPPCLRAGARQEGGKCHHNCIPPNYAQQVLAESQPPRCQHTMRPHWVGQASGSGAGWVPRYAHGAMRGGCSCAHTATPAALYTPLLQA